MKIDHINNYKGGWLIGDFVPAILNRKDIEVGIHHVSKGTHGDGHFHIQASEINVIITGQVLLDHGLILRAGAIWVYHPYEKSEVYFEEDTILLVIKTKSVKNDKFYGCDTGTDLSRNEADSSNLQRNPLDKKGDFIYVEPPGEFHC